MDKRLCAIEKSMDMVNDVITPNISLTYTLLITLSDIILQEFFDVMEYSKIKITKEAIKNQQEKVYSVDVYKKHSGDYIVYYYNYDEKLILQNNISKQQLKEFLYITFKYNFLYPRYIRK